MKFLIIQTAFIGDVVLASALAESLSHLNHIEVHYLVRKGNEGLLENNPNIQKVWVWNKQEKKNQKSFQTHWRDSKGEV